MAIAIQKAQTIAISKAGRTRHIKRIVTNLLHSTHKLAYGLWGIERCDIWLATINEIGGVTTIKGTIQVGRKCIFATSLRCTTILIRMLADVGIQSLAIGSRHVLHVSHILQSSLNLKRYGTSFNQLLQIIALVHILEREQIALVLDLCPIGIDQREAHPTELGALTTIGATLETMLRGITDARIADAQGTVNKHLELHIWHLAMNLGYLVC